MIKLKVDAHFEYALSVATQGLVDETCKDYLDIAEFEEFFASIDMLTDEQISALAHRTDPEGGIISQDCAMFAGSFPISTLMHACVILDNYDIDDSFSLFDEVTNVLDRGICEARERNVSHSYCLNYDKWMADVCDNTYLVGFAGHARGIVPFASATSNAFYEEFGKRQVCLEDKSTRIYGDNPLSWIGWPIYSDRQRSKGRSHGEEMCEAQMPKRFVE